MNRIGGIAALVLTSLSAGWLSVPLLDGSPKHALAAHSPVAPRVTPPGVTTGLAVRRLDSLAIAQVPEPREQPPVKTATAQAVVNREPPRQAAPRPPAEEIETRFRRELTAIVATSGRPRVLMVDPSAPAGRRQLGEGERYRDGWQLASVEDQFVTLTRGVEERRIAIFEAARDAAPMRVAQSVPITAPLAEPARIVAQATNLEAELRPRRLLARPNRQN